MRLAVSGGIFTISLPFRTDSPFMENPRFLFQLCSGFIFDIVNLQANVKHVHHRRAAERNDVSRQHVEHKSAFGLENVDKILVRDDKTANDEQENHEDPDQGFSLEDLLVVESYDRLSCTRPLHDVPFAVNLYLWQPRRQRDTLATLFHNHAVEILEKSKPFPIDEEHPEKQIGKPSNSECVENKCKRGLYGRFHSKGVLV
mmetsp:Transcript_24861/g.48580  ORF Transcript_24861/g.48580 Transcript_24861/m.48580 type:complete len:201 (-) Transcript_24861:1013-1615(-)